MTRVLVVEDDEIVRFLLVSLLRKAGYEVVVAANGREGLACYRQGHADVILTDIFMPVMDGVEMMIDLARSHPEARVVVISGGSKMIYGRSALRTAELLGAKRVIRKPVVPDELLSSVAFALE